MIFRGTRLSDISKTSIALIVIGFIVVGLSFNFFFELGETVLEDEKFAIDAATTEFINSISTPWIVNAMGLITEAGSVMFLTIASIILAIYLFFFSSFSRWVTVFFAINMGGISALTKILKLSYARKRPSVLEKYDGTGFSFPSGHTTGSIVFYGFIIYLVTVSHLGKRLKWSLNIFIALFALCIGISRLFLGVHFITDVMAGISFGLSWLLICIMALEITLWNQRRRQVKH
ncbi:phosphatase PAP2 family protein [Pontibacillus sp. HMF3514]|uniref:phosphatase PAP2 family protein n=1 Tax=Pontibacillus sp. HMF3514 TaxID=2692425 RepID=UPI00131FCE0B|nr:phosphatase PAP2 family protein [Pontibacillus sp. HMF3514]QHE53898.1 phosphatase PAP2 family protein [Pontibacillus sp. HMF3514]